MLKIIKKYIIENKNFFIILLVNFFIFYPKGEIYDFTKIVYEVKFSLYDYIFFINILMILKYRKALKYGVVIIAFLLRTINYFLVDYYLLEINFNMILGIIYIYIVVSNYKETDNSKNKVIYLIIPLFLECINMIIMLWYVDFFEQYRKLDRRSIHMIIMLLPYIFMFPITVIVLSKLKNMKKELKAIVISLLLTLLLCLILSLIDIENIIIMVTLFSILYLFIRDIKLNKKIIMIYIFILAGICGYMYVEREDKAWIKLKEDYDEELVSGYRDEKIGICYKRIGFKKLICGEIINGKKEGKWRGWYEDGERKFEGSYVGDKKEGKWIFYNKNGQKKEEGNYLNGKEDGKYISWYENGQKQEEVTYKDGKEIKRIHYDEEGNCIEE